MPECGGWIMVDGEAIQGQTDDGTISFEFCGGPQRKLPTNNQGIESHARAIAQYESFQQPTRS